MPARYSKLLIGMSHKLRVAWCETEGCGPLLASHSNVKRVAEECPRESGPFSEGAVSRQDLRLRA